MVKMAAAIVDAAYVDIVRAIGPGTKENELVAIANDELFRMGAERVECVNSVSGRRSRRTRAHLPIACSSRAT